MSNDPITPRFRRAIQRPTEVATIAQFEGRKRGEEKAAGEGGEGDTLAVPHSKREPNTGGLGIHIKTMLPVSGIIHLLLTAKLT